MAADYPKSETASEPEEGKWKEITLKLDGTDIKVSLLRKGKFESYDRTGAEAAIRADAEEMKNLCDKLQTVETASEPDPTLKKIVQLVLRVMRSDGCDFDLKFLAAQVLIETQREKMEKAASERVVEFTGSKTVSGEAAREALGYPPVSEKDLNPPATETEKMIPLSAVAPLIRMAAGRIYRHKSSAEECAVYDRAANAVGGLKLSADLVNESIKNDRSSLPIPGWDVLNAIKTHPDMDKRGMVGLELP
jgi:hypothetical protein